MFTYQFTNNTVSWQKSWGFKKLSVRCLSTSTASGTVQGTDVAGGYTSGAITIESNAGFTDITDLSSVGDLTIIAPSGCTLQILGSKSQ